eukprot:5647369-Prymnesium_polylepis.1
MSNRETACAFVSWAADRAARLRQQQLLRGALARLVHGDMACGWGGWQQMVEERKATLDKM